MSSRSVKVIAFDLFGTIFDLSATPREELAAYAAHISQNEWSPITFPKSWEDLPVFPDAKYGLMQLRSQHYVITFSNCPIALQEVLCRKHSLRFDYLFNLEYFKVFKPNPLAYTYLANWRGDGSKPSETLVVSANKNFGDIEGARAAGMQSQLIRHGKPATVTELAECLM